MTENRLLGKHVNKIEIVELIGNKTTDKFSRTSQQNSSVTNE